MNKDKRLMFFTACSISVLLISSITLLVANLIINNKDIDTIDYERPLNRGKNYEHFQLRKWLLTNNDLHQIINAKFENGKYIRYIEESKLKNFFKYKFRNMFKSISKFEINADNFEFEFHYQLFNDDTSLFLDVVWQLPNNNYHYYDQIKLTLC